jgi:mannose-1-phosphate guanylyltransferase
LDLAAQQDVLITVGIKPDRPATGYGYIHFERGFTRKGVRFWNVQEFVEKPDLKTARRFVQSGEYRWNAGMFVWHVGSIRAAFKKYQPDMWRQIENITNARSLKRIYPKLDKISVDYAIMEKAGNVVVANGDFDWDDVGDWPAVERHYPKDAYGNVARGEAVALNASNCVIVSAGNHLVAVVGVNDLVVVHTADATLICHKSEAQRVREIPKQLAGQPKYKKLL